MGVQRAIALCQGFQRGRQSPLESSSLNLWVTGWIWLSPRSLSSSTSFDKICILTISNSLRYEP
jgi:hypothetical protein